MELPFHDLAVSTAGQFAIKNDTGCAQEPIHVPGSIQPHGVLLALDASRDFIVVAASRNAADVLISSSPATPVIGSSIACILGRDFAEAVQSRLQGGRLRGEAPWQSTVRLPGQLLTFDVAVHAHAGLVHVELERAAAGDAADAQAAMRQLQQIIVDFRETGNDLDELARLAAAGVRLVTGYDRVVIHRFDAEWNGQTIAEDKAADWDQSLAGLRFPASDIPAQARELYRRSPMRWVADRDAAPLPLAVDPAWLGDPRSPRAVDLSFVRLRSLSPVHLQIHRNLDIDGCMSLSIVHQERLWGLVVCHHRQPHHPSPSQ